MDRPLGILINPRNRGSDELDPIFSSFPKAARVFEKTPSVR